MDETKVRLEKEIEHSRPMIERIKTLRETITDKTKISDKVGTFLTLHKQTSEIFQSISELGELKATFNKDTFKIEEDDEASGGNTASGGSDTVDADHGKLPPQPISPVVKQNPLQNEASLKKYYTSKTFRPKLHWSKCSRPSGVNVAPWQHAETRSHLLYICGTDSRLIYGIEMAKGRIVQRISCDDMIFPNSIAFSEERREIFVADKWKHCIFVFAENGDYLRTLCAKGDIEGYLR